MTDTAKEIPGFSPELDQQLREAFSGARLRLSPESNVSKLHAYLEGQGFDAKAGEYGLRITRKDSGADVNPAEILNALARKPENAAQFVLPGGEIQNFSDFHSANQKQEYIQKNGLAAFERLVARSGTTLRADVVLHRDLDSEGYKNLTRAEKVEFINRFGVGAVGAAINRKSKP